MKKDGKTISQIAIVDKSLPLLIVRIIASLSISPEGIVVDPLIVVGLIIGLLGIVGLVGDVESLIGLIGAVWWLVGLVSVLGSLVGLMFDEPVVWLVSFVGSAVSY